MIFTAKKSEYFLFDSSEFCSPVARRISISPTDMRTPANLSTSKQNAVISKTCFFEWHFLIFIFQDSNATERQQRLFSNFWHLSRFRADDVFSGQSSGAQKRLFQSESAVAFGISSRYRKRNHLVKFVKKVTNWPTFPNYFF